MAAAAVATTTTTAAAAAAAEAAVVGSEKAGPTLVLPLKRAGAAHPCIHALTGVYKNQLGVAINQKHNKTGRRNDEVAAAAAAGG